MRNSRLIQWSIEALQSGDKTSDDIVEYLKHRGENLRGRKKVSGLSSDAKTIGILLAKHPEFFKAKRKWGGYSRFGVLMPTVWTLAGGVP